MLDREELLIIFEAKAAENDGSPLTFFGHEVDKTNARQIYGALCWVLNTIHTPTHRHLDHQFKDWETRPYIHPPDFDEVYERLMRIDAARLPAPREYHQDWKS